MLSARFSRFTQPCRQLLARTYASEVTSHTSATIANSKQEPVTVNPDHGLYHFFRKTTASDGEVKYETLANQTERNSPTGRSWKASELRLKSFKDLHTLWYVLLRERNVLATQNEELRRIAGHPTAITTKQAHMVRKSMARIKYVLNERRLAYEGAVDLVATKNMEKPETQEVYKHQLARYNKLQQRDPEGSLRAKRRERKIRLASEKKAREATKAHAIETTRATIAEEMAAEEAAFDAKLEAEQNQKL